MSDRINLQKRRDTFKKLMQQLSSKYEGLKAQLNENETFTQVRSYIPSLVEINFTCFCHLIPVKFSVHTHLFLCTVSLFRCS